jgi:hypothetical protein
MDIIQPDICAAGGFTECMTIAAGECAWGSLQFACLEDCYGKGGILHWIAVLFDTHWSILLRLRFSNAVELSIRSATHYFRLNSSPGTAE